MRNYFVVQSMFMLLYNSFLDMVKCGGSAAFINDRHLSAPSMTFLCAKNAEHASFQIQILCVRPTEEDTHILGSWISP
jgi:hypothetical protein